MVVVVEGKVMGERYVYLNTHALLSCHYQKHALKEKRLSALDNSFSIWRKEGRGWADMLYPMSCLGCWSMSIVSLFGWGWDRHGCCAMPAQNGRLEEEDRTVLGHACYCRERLLLPPPATTHEKGKGCQPALGEACLLLSVMSHVKRRRKAYSVARLPPWSSRRKG